MSTTHAAIISIALWHNYHAKQPSLVPILISLRLGSAIAYAVPAFFALFAASLPSACIFPSSEISPHGFPCRSYRCPPAAISKEEREGGRKAGREERADRDGNEDGGGRRGESRVEIAGSPAIRIESTFSSCP